MRGALRLLALGWRLASPAPSHTQPFFLPTANRAWSERGGEERFFVGTPGKSWTSGTFGGVRSDGRQLHEGWDVRCLKRDARGEPTDPVMATAEGTVVYINARSALSNYGNYLVLQHQVQGLEVYSLYAHLREVRPDLKPGRKVAAGERIATMGRTSNTRSGISRERAHVHFELDLRLSDRFTAWQQAREPQQRNDHGEWNGRNLLGIDPMMVFQGQARQRTNFNLVRALRDQPELCRLRVRATNFSWLRRYAPLIETNPKALREGIAGYELALNYCGLPIRVIPRSPSETTGSTRLQLLSVNEGEQAAHPCGNLVQKRGGRWALAHSGERLLDLLTY